MCRRYFRSQEIDSHYATESGSTAYSRNSCRMRYFYHVQLFEITRAYKIKSPISKNRATPLNSSTCFEAATLRISKAEHFIARLRALAAQPPPSVPRLRASTLFGRRLAGAPGRPPCYRRPKTCTTAAVDGPSTWPAQQSAGMIQPASRERSVLRARNA